MKTPKLNPKITFEIQLNETEKAEVSGKVIEVLPTGRVKIEYEHPVQGLMIRIISTNQ